MHILTFLLFFVFALIGATTSFVVVGRGHSEVRADSKSIKVNPTLLASNLIQGAECLSSSVSLRMCDQEIDAHGQRIYTFDLDDVVNIREQLGVSEGVYYLALYTKLFVREPVKAVKLAWNWRAIKARAEEIAAHTNGATNVIYTLSQEFSKNGHPDIAPYIYDIITHFVKPKPIWPIINYIKELKKQGYCVIGATNQDYFHNKCIRARMAEQGVDLDELFYAIVISHSTTEAQYIVLKDALIHEVEPGVYMPCSPNGHKPHAHFYEALKVVGHKFISSPALFIHTDDKIENIHGAEAVEGFAAVHFHLPDGKSARRCTEAELQATFLAWKSAIEKIN